MGRVAKANRDDAERGCQKVGQRGWPHLVGVDGVVHHGPGPAREVEWRGLEPQIGHSIEKVSSTSQHAISMGTTARAWVGRS